MSPVPGTNTPTEIVDTLLSSRLYFPAGKLCSGISGDCHVQSSPRSLSLHIRQTNPPRRLYRPADSPQRDLGRHRWMVLGPECRGSNDNCPSSALTSYLSLSLLSSDGCHGPCCHTLRRRSLTVRTLCLRREEWDHDPPAGTTRNSYEPVLIFSQASYPYVRI